MFVFAARAIVVVVGHLVRTRVAAHFGRVSPIPVVPRRWCRRLENMDVPARITSAAARIIIVVGLGPHTTCNSGWQSDRSIVADVMNVAVIAWVAHGSQFAWGTAMALSSRGSWWDHMRGTSDLRHRSPHDQGCAQPRHGGQGPTPLVLVSTQLHRRRHPCSGVVRHHRALHSSEKAASTMAPKKAPSVAR
ncbi:hypothetical protein EDB85DRAFT_2064400 [Lactarius pseudohatsudake]|nr:hypothetical protein EDB85DRAFT_2064400 [Lactarius pseudohatsudake]